VPEPDGARANGAQRLLPILYSRSAGRFGVCWSVIRKRVTQRRRRVPSWWPDDRARQHPQTGFPDRQEDARCRYQVAAQCISAGNGACFIEQTRKNTLPGPSAPQRNRLKSDDLPSPPQRKARNKYPRERNCGSRTYLTRLDRQDVAGPSSTTSRLVIRRPPTMLTLGCSSRRRRNNEAGVKHGTVHNVAKGS
jgi:hypothetical protein